MKKIVSACIAFLLLFVFAPKGFASGEIGTAVLSSETVLGSVGDIVAVNIYLERNCEGDFAIDSMQGSFIYDPEYLTFGSFKHTDESNGLDSVSNESGGLWQLREGDKGIILMSFASAYGIKEDGFLIQLLFRIEKEGGTRIAINSFEYGTWSRSTGETKGYWIEPFYVAGVVTEGFDVDLTEKPDLTFTSLSKEARTPAPNQQTQTPVPSKDTELEMQNSSIPEELLNYTPNPATDAPFVPTETSGPIDPNVPDTTEPPTLTTEMPNSDPNTTGESDLPEIEVDIIETDPAVDQKPQVEGQGSMDTPSGLTPIAWILIGLGSVAVLLLSVAAVFIIIRKRRK